jgi:hypothetical protein
VLAKQRVGYQKAGEKCTQTATLLLGADLTGEDFSFIFLFCIAGPLYWYVLPSLSCELFPLFLFSFHVQILIIFWMQLSHFSLWHCVDLSRGSLRGALRRPPCGSLHPADA